MKRRLPVLALVSMLLSTAGAFLHGCSNSPLRNFTEAGLESTLDDPLPTPTARKK